MVYEQALSGSFNWDAFSSVLDSLGRAGALIYSSYAQMQVARVMAAGTANQQRIDLQIAELERQAIELMATQKKGSDSATMKTIMPLAITGAVGAIALLSMR